MKIAVIGLGSIGSRHVDTLLAMGHDPVGFDLRPMPDEPRLPVLHTEEDLWDWQPTHVLVCTPPASHYEWTKEAVSRGAHVFVEKPLTETATDARLLVSHAQQHGCILAVGYMERAHAAVQEAHAAGPFTELLLECYWESAPKTYPLDVLQESSHTFDLALHLMGPVRDWRHEHTAQGKRWCLQHASGVSHVVIGMNTNHVSERRITGTTADRRTYYAHYGQTTEEWDACYRAELEAFVNGTPLCTGYEGWHVTELIERLR